jgi:hypothetical protein
MSEASSEAGDMDMNDDEDDEVDEEVSKNMFYWFYCA